MPGRQPLSRPVAHLPQWRYTDCVSYPLPPVLFRSQIRPLPAALLVEPDVFHAPAVVDAVDHDREVPDLGVPADSPTVKKDQRLSLVLRPPALDSPNEPLALFLVRFDRLLLDQFVDLRVAIAVVVADPAAGIILIKHRIGIVDQRAGQVERDRVVLALHLGIPLGGVYRLELALDIDLLQLVDEDYRRIAVWGYVSGSDLDVQPLVGPVAELLHNLAGLVAIGCHVRPVAGQLFEHLQWHAPLAAGPGLHRRRTGARPLR